MVPVNLNFSKGEKHAFNKDNTINEVLVNQCFKNGSNVTTEKYVTTNEISGYKLKKTVHTIF